MQLSDLHVQGLFAAAHSREMIKRAWLLDAMTVVNEYSHNISTDKILKIGTTIEIEASIVDADYGQVVCLNKTHKGVVLSNKGMLLTIAVLSNANEPIYHRLDTFQFLAQEVEKWFGQCALATGDIGQVTTVGRLLENVIVLGYPTDFKVFGYMNCVWKGKKILKIATDALMTKKIDIEQYRSFIDNFFYLNHISEICVPSATERSLMTDPRVPEIKRKFIEEHKGQMNDPFVIKELEDQLIALDKEWLRGDPSSTFFDGLGNKMYAVNRKKLFLMVGGIPAFDESSGKYDFNPNSLMDGWTKDSIPSIANEVRKGSYDRGRETAKGGAETKSVFRVFQDLTISKDDCGTKRTIKADFKNTFRISDFIGRTICVGGTDIVLTPENISKYDGQVVDLYSPLTCSEKYDLCYKCCGHRLKELGVKKLGLQTVKITSQFMQTAMKAMHGTVLQTKEPKLSDVLL